MTALLGRVLCWDPSMHLLRVWRFTFSWRPGAWRRPGEWARPQLQPCELGCIVVDFWFFTVEFLRGMHYTDQLEGDEP